MSIPIQLPLDDDGFLDRECPNAECEASFKVLFEDWRDKVQDDVVYCPICRFESEHTTWFSPEQKEYIESIVFRHAMGQIDKMMQKTADEVNRSSRPSGFVSVSMSYRPGDLPILMPLMASEVMRQRSTCEACGCQYSSIGAAFFCPACGHNSAESTFDGAIDAVRKTMDALDTIRQQLTEAIDQDTAADSIRQFIEGGLAKLTATFQRFAEARFDSLQNRSAFKPRRNLFQNLADSSDLWRTAIGSGYDDMLTQTELADLERYFQQRHLLSHKEGIVDQAYLDKSSDSRYGVGQRLVVRKESVQHLSDLLVKLAAELRRRS